MVKCFAAIPLALFSGTGFSLAAEDEDDFLCRLGKQYVHAREWLLESSRSDPLVCRAWAILRHLAVVQKASARKMKSGGFLTRLHLQRRKGGRGKEMALSTKEVQKQALRKAGRVLQALYAAARRAERDHQTPRVLGSCAGATRRRTDSPGCTPA